MTDISILLLTKNGAATLQQLGQALIAQATSRTVEILQIDSGSTDASCVLLSSLVAGAGRPGWTYQLHRIAPAEFGHGRTRNLAARLSTGRVLIYLSQDAIPQGPSWLDTLLGPLTGDTIAGAFARQVAGPAVSLPERYFLNTAYPLAASRRTAEGIARFGAGHILFSNVASAIRREVWEQYPFRDDLMMSEDQQWAVAVLRAGYQIAYVGSAVVEHSHNYALAALFRRNFDSGASLAMAGTGTAGAAMHPADYLRYLAGECRFVVAHGGLTTLPGMVAFEGTRTTGYLLGSQHRRLPLALSRRLSAYPRWFPGRRPAEGWKR